MPTTKQKKAARRNIRKAQQKWKSMTSREHALAQPQGRSRTKPGVGGKGKYYHVVVRPKEQFTSFRSQDVGRKGHSVRVAGHRASGSWATQKWLISKKDAHKEGDILVADDISAKKILRKLGSVPRHAKGDVFEAHDRPNVPEKDKPTRAQKKSQTKNIKKAQKARWSS